jgi:ABC-type transport system involved in Fe-S cluster assembly fused permease/ATPase subunit
MEKLQRTVLEYYKNSDRKEETLKWAEGMQLRNIIKSLPQGLDTLFRRKTIVIV